ncbi:hypothetical protein D3C73_1390390 [compost metagenome]
MCGVQRKAFRENFEQTVVHGLRVLEHWGVRLQEDIDGGDFRFGARYGKRQYTSQ